MATFRVSLAFPFDTALPKDVITINPHFSGQDAQALANALHANLIAANPTAGKPFTVKVYDAATPPPSYPLATVSEPGTPPGSSMPREVALCCSYYTTYNRPRYRGRLYLPVSWFTAVVNLRPSQAIMDAALAFIKTVFGTGMPASTNWVVYSQVEKKAQGGVNKLWIDDEWDTVRSRGLTATQRVLANFP